MVPWRKPSSWSTSLEFVPNVARGDSHWNSQMAQYFILTRRINCHPHPENIKVNFWVGTAVLLTDSVQ